MKTPTFLHSVRRPVILLACASILGLPTALSAASTDKEPVYENYIDFASGYATQSGDRPGFQKAFQLRKDGYFGIEDLRYVSELDDTTTLKLRGKAMAGNGDFLLDLTINRDEVGYIKFGYKQFRTYFDGSGGVWPATGFSFNIFDEEMHIDRGNLWLEAGLNRPDQVSLMLRYDLLTREGEKDSTSWGDTNLVGATRGLVPSFMKIDETRNVLQATAGKRTEKNDWSIGLRYDKGDYDNGRYERRRALEPTADRYITHKEGQDYDMFQMRGSYIVDLSEKIKLTTAVSRTKIETELTGSRIVGAGYDAAYSATYPTRQQRDEGFFAIAGHPSLGESEMTQTVATLSMLYRPLPHLAIVPSLRFEKTEWENLIEFVETNIGAANTGFAATREDIEADSHKDWDTMNAGVEFRYTGVKNFTFNFRSDWSNSEGHLAETRIIEPGTSNEKISVDRSSELERATQKYSFTTNWYAMPGVTVAAQYYFKARQSDFLAVRDTTPNTITSSDRYPAYISNQDFETSDFNVRLTWRLTPTVRSVTRYDYLQTTINSQEVGLPFGESGTMTQKIFSESITWNPLARWLLQANLNYVTDSFETPANFATGTAADLVTPSNTDYTSYGLSSSYALDDQSDLILDYTSYEARDSWIDNSAKTTPYGYQTETQTFSAAWKRKIDRRTTITLKYAYVESKDPVLAGKGDYEANMIQAKLQYRF